MALYILGLSHKTAPVAVREKVAIDEGQLGSALDALHACEGVSESMILSTCNRTELYCDLAADAAQAPADWLARYRRLARDEIEPHLYRLDNEHAVRHVLRVASGLDSMVLGEPQILGQLKNAYRTAVAAGTIGKLLNRLLQFSFSTAKLIRAETDIGNTPVSVAYAAVKLAQQIHGDLSTCSALLIGAGDTIALVANHLASARLGHLIVANRTRSTAEELARRYGGEAIDMNRLPARLADADIIVSSTASRLPIVTRGIVELALERREGAPVFIVDLAVPRDIDPAVAKLDDAYLYTIDDLEHVINANLELRREAAAQAEEMVHLQVQDYMDWLELQGSSATIRALRSHGEQIREEVLARALRRIELGEDPRQVLERLAWTLTNKLLHQPTAGLRRAGRREEVLRTARELFGLRDGRE